MSAQRIYTQRISRRVGEGILHGGRILVAAGLAVAAILPGCSGEQMTGSWEGDFPVTVTRPAYTGWWATSDDHQHIGLWDMGRFEYRVNVEHPRLLVFPLVLEEFVALRGHYKKTGAFRTDREMMYFSLEGAPGYECARPFVVRNDSLLIRSPDLPVVFTRVIPRDSPVLYADPSPGTGE